MLDKEGIYKRYIEDYAIPGITELAAYLGIKYQTIHGWKKGKYPIPWSRLKKLIDEKGLCWDWLIDGKEPKHRKRRKNEALKEELDRHAINQRYLSLFPKMS